MKLRRIRAGNSKAGLKRIEQEFSQDAYILANTRRNGNNIFLIATDAPTPATESATTPTGGFEAVYKEQVQQIEQSAEPPVDKPADAPRDTRAMVELAGLIRQEFDTMKSDLLRLQSQAGGAQDAHREATLQSLGEWGVPNALLLQLRQQSGCLDDMMSLSASLRSLLEARLPDSRPVPMTQPVHVLVGNHGAGKTLAAVKLAMWMKQQGRNAIVVGYRDDKEGAWSQLQLLGAKSDVRIYRAASPADLHAVALEYHGHATVIVDAAASHTTERLAELKAAAPGAAFHLVAPCDAYHASLRRFLADPQLKFESMLLTRLDMDGPGWPILRLQMEHGIPLSLGSASADSGTGLLELHPTRLVDLMIACFERDFIMPLSTGIPDINKTTQEQGAARPR